MIAAWLLAAAAVAAPSTGSGPAGPSTGSGLAAPADELRRIRGFADDLFASGEWFRAATEYRRFLAYAPGDPDAEEIRYAIARCSYRASRYAEAAEAFLRLGAATSATELRDRCALMAAAARFRDRAWGDADDLCAAALARYADASRPGPAEGAAPHRDRLAYLAGLARIHRHRWAQAVEAFGAVPAGSPLAGSAADLAGLARRAAARPRHPAWVAVLGSAVLPGLGQTLEGAPMDGLTSLGVIAAGVGVAIAGDRTGQPTVRATGAAVAGVFYLAGLTGAAGAARRADRRAVGALEAEADAASRLDLE